MKERELRDLIADVKTGRLSRRAFVQRMIAVGLTAPMAGMMLAQSGVAMAATEIPYKPTKAGGGGLLKMLYWQAVTLLNPHFAVGTKDQDGSRIFYEPLAGWDGDGNLVPVLAAEIPSKENDGLAEDGRSVIWKLKQGVKWHDGKPFTADDVVFNWEYARTPETAAVSIASYKDIKVEKIDDFTVRVIFAKPTPFWADAFVGTYGMIIPKHLFADYIGGKSRDAPANLKPVGTGPYMFVDFKPGDMVRGQAQSRTTTSPTGRISIRSKSRAAATRCRPRARCCRPANMTMPGTCRWRTKSCSSWKRPARARCSISRDRQYRVHHAQLDRSGDRGRRRARQRQDQASAVQRPGGAPGHQPADRSRLDREIHLWPHRQRHRELPQQPGTLPLEEHQIRIQHREGQRRSSRPPAGRRAPTAFAPRTASR